MFSCPATADCDHDDSPPLKASLSFGKIEHINVHLSLTWHKNDCGGKVPIKCYKVGRGLYVCLGFFFVFLCVNNKFISRDQKSDV